MKFIDIFSGLGGFHVGLKNNGHECVFSCEINEDLRDLYEINHGIRPHDDIRTVSESDVPAHDILCAGFPCQPFSLAGKKKGAKCPESGRLIDHVVRIADYHKPQFVLLENVPNVLTIENGTFWDYVRNSFERIGYRIDYRVISPVDLGIPQNRKRVFILGTRSDINAESFKWPSASDEGIVRVSLEEVLDNTLDHKKLESKKSDILALWQELLNGLNIATLCSVSIVAPEFGATYPENFSKLSLRELKHYKGAYGQSLEHCHTWAELLALMPSYVQKGKQIPQWMLKSIRFSRNLYQANENFCDQWAKKLSKINNSWQILEWRGAHVKHVIKDHIVQFRASGIRILKADIAPSLIAMTPTQIPIIPSESRYVSKHEAAKLQYLHTLKKLPEKNNAAFKALGNAVNAKIIELIGKNLIPVSL
ncbi:DNA cytosine methyltransferase [Undibacterium rugosum]|nr:DNA (cytosine-5-)-methyltransferase [Undibacterium rugosum]MBR7777945.1 DNA (cytosine-5-)-methyltransferase [Undibacterium rugosum]